MNKKHGCCKRGMHTKEYRTWQNIKNRCSLKCCINYKYYGGRGITVCERWRNSFENFLEDMGKCPEGFWIDRIDNNGDYCKDNCRWSTASENIANRRNTLCVNISQIAKEIGADYKTIYRRMKLGKDLYAKPMVVGALALKLKTSANNQVLQ